MMILFLSSYVLFLSRALSIVIAIGVSSLALLLAVLISVILTNYIIRAYRKTLTINKCIQIENMGNTDAVFRLKTDNQSDQLILNLLHNDTILPRAVIIPKEEIELDDAQPVLRQKTPARPGQKARGKAKKSVSETSGGVKQKSKAGINFARQIGGLLGALGNFLPGSLGAGFKEKSTALQSKTQTASTAVDAPDQKKQELEHIQRQTKNLSPGSKKASEGQEKKDHSEMPSEMVETAGLDEVPVEQKSEKKKRSSRRKPILSEMVETPMVLAGEDIVLQLQISPVNVYKAGTFQFSIMSEQLTRLESKDFEVVNTNMAKDEVKIKGISNYVGAIYFLLLLIVVSLNAYWVIVFLKWFISILF